MPRPQSRADENRLIFLVANTSWFLYRFNLDLAKALRREGWEVVLVAPRDEFSERLESAGFRLLHFPLSRRSLLPWTELSTLLHLRRLYLRERPRGVHHFTLKCILYGAIAAAFEGGPAMVHSVTGLGSLYASSAPWAKILRRALEQALRLATRGTDLIFLNRHDRDHFLAAGIVPGERAHLILGSGVDIRRFDLPAETRVDHREPVEPGSHGATCDNSCDLMPMVVLPARMLWSKGVGDFVAAATRLAAAGVKARWVLVGGTDSQNPDSIPETQLESWVRNNKVEWWGFTEDMIGVYRRAAIVCLPTSYREGVPTVLLEAAACRRPVVATDMPGCREVVVHGSGGLLVPPGDPEALAAALGELLADPERRRQMGEAARLEVARELSVDGVVAATLNLYRRVLEAPPRRRERI